MGDRAIDRGAGVRASIAAGTPWQRAALRTIERYAGRVGQSNRGMYYSYKRGSRAGTLNAFTEAANTFAQMHRAVSELRHPASEDHLRELILGVIDGMGRGYGDLAAAYRATGDAAAGLHFRRAVLHFQSAKRDGHQALVLLHLKTPHSSG